MVTRGHFGSRRGRLRHPQVPRLLPGQEPLLRTIEVDAERQRNGDVEVGRGGLSPLAPTMNIRSNRQSPQSAAFRARPRPLAANRRHCVGLGPTGLVSHRHTGMSPSARSTRAPLGEPSGAPDRCWARDYNPNPAHRGSRWVARRRGAPGMRDGYLRGALPSTATPAQRRALAAYVAAGGSVPDAARTSR